MKSQPERSADVNEEVEFRALLDSANDLIFILSPVARFLYTNQAFQSALGYSEQELRTLGIFDLLHPSCLEKCRQHFQALAEHADQPALETGFVTKDGRAITVEGNCSSGDQNGHPGVIRGIFRDVTESKQAAEALRNTEQFVRDILDNLVGFVALFTPDGIVLEVNRPPLERSGLRREDVIGKEFAETYSWNYAPEVQVQIRDAFRRVAQGEIVSGDFRPRMTENVFIDTFAIFAPLRDAGGKVVKIVGSGFDITERKQAERQLKESSVQLRALSARLQSAREEEGARIAREIHDELGGALTGLKWDLERIDKVLSSAANGTSVQTVREKIPDMTGLIESTINTVRRISYELRPGVLDDLGLVAAIEWQAQQFQSRTGIECQCVADTDGLGLSRERATALFRIFQEILTNVIRHAQATRVGIKLSEHDGRLELRVNDNGRGITEAEMRNPRSLGLLGMRERALLVGGEVTISGALGQGTAVTASVPCGG